MECPAACECAHSDTKSINCSRRGLTHIPRLPATVDHLDLSHNELVDIPSDSFENATLLRLLDMSHNRIAQIEQDVSIRVFTPLYKTTHFNNMFWSLMHRPSRTLINCNT